MNYENIGIANFCNFLTGAGGIDSIGYDLSTVSKIDMYNYIKIKTENFNSILLEIFISELRDCAYDLKFLRPNTTEGVFYYDLYYTIETMGVFFPKIKPPLIFTKDKTLRERVDIIIELLPDAVFKHSTKKLLQLSDMAEFEYQKLFESTNTGSFITNDINARREQKTTIQERIEVLNYNEIGLYEFFVRLTYDEHFSISESEMYLYIKHKTDNFDLETFELFRKELNFLSGGIKFVPPLQITNDNNVELTILEFHHKFIITPRLEEIYKNENPIENIKKLDKYVDLFTNEFDAKMKIQEIQRYYTEYDFGLIVRYRKIIRFSDLIFSIYEKLFDSQAKQPESTVTPTPKQQLTFAGLFKPEYIDRLTVLFERLKLNGYTDENNDWIIKTDTNEPAKLFHYLKDNDVFITSKFAPSIKCFYKEFGCEVVEKINGNPRATTRVNAQAAKNSVNESAFNNFVLSWIDKK